MFKMFKKVRPKLIAYQNRKGNTVVKVRGLRDSQALMITLYRLMQHLGAAHKVDAGFIIKRLSETHKNYTKEVTKATKPKKKYGKGK